MKEKSESIPRLDYSARNVGWRVFETGTTDPIVKPHIGHARRKNRDAIASLAVNSRDIVRGPVIDSRGALQFNSRTRRLEFGRATVALSRRANPLAWPIPSKAPKTRLVKPVKTRHPIEDFWRGAADIGELNRWYPEHFGSLSGEFWFQRRAKLIDHYQLKTIE